MPDPPVEPLPVDNFTDVIAGFGDPPSPSAACVDADQLVSWQGDFHRTLVQLRGWLPERVVPDVEVIAEVDAGDHRRLTLGIAVSAITRVVAYLLIPKSPGANIDLPAGEQRAGLVALHGHYRHGIDSICGVRIESEDPDNDERHAYALHAVRAGYVVIAPALWGWPGRDGHLDLVGSRDRCNTILMASAMYGVNPLDLHVQDAQAALDVLSSRPEVDAARIGALGNSTGGRMTMWLTLHDERVRACVPSGCMNHFRERSQKLSSCGIRAPFGLLRHGDVRDLFCLIAPRAMQLHAGEGDQLITPTDRDAMLGHVRRAYGLLGAGDRLDYVLHDAGHLLDWPRAAPFLNRFLRG